MLDERINSVEDYQFKVFSGKEGLMKTVGKYDLHFRGFYKKDLFKKVSFRFTEKLVNADEIVERQLLEYSNKIGICPGVYTHYIFLNSSAKSFNLKKTDLLVTDIYLRNYFKNLNFYKTRKDIFELTAYKNFVTGLKTYLYFRKNLSKEEQNFYEDRLKKSYNNLDKRTILQQYTGISKIYNSLLLSSYKTMYNFYKIKK